MENYLSRAFCKQRGLTGIDGICYNIIAPELDLTGGCFPSYPSVAVCFLQTDYIGREGDSMEILYVILAIVLLLIFVVLFVIINEIIKNIKK